MECSICLESIADKDLMHVPGCKHIFHSHCFLSYIKHNVENGGGKVSCPQCRHVVIEIPSVSETITVEREENLPPGTRAALEEAEDRERVLIRFSLRVSGLVFGIWAAYLFVTMEENL